MENASSDRLPSSQSLLGAYFRFLRSPGRAIAPAARPSSQIRNHILRLYSLHLIAILLIGIVISQLVDQQDSLLLELFADIPVWYMLGTAVVLVPLVEEIIFRLPLQGTLFNLSASVSLAAFIAMFGLLANPTVAIGLGAALAGWNSYLWFAQPRLPVLDRVYHRYPRPIFYFAALLFGLIHITNYDQQVWALLPLLVLPQVVIGFWLGFIRLGYGFGWAVLAHGFHNACILLPFAAMKLLGSPQLQTQGAAAGTPLTPGDILLMLGVAVYVFGGLILCGRTAWVLLREWRQAPTSSQGSDI